MKALLGNRVLVELIPAAPSHQGLITPVEFRPPRPNEGIVRAIGTGDTADAMQRKHQALLCELKVGDRVRLDEKRMGFDTKVNGQPARVVSVADIFWIYGD